MSVVHQQVEPPDFLKLLAHDLRWKLIIALVRSDHRVQELVSLLNQPANLVSYHLKQLRGQRLVTERRSAADARDVYYRINLEQLRDLYIMAGAALHPALIETESKPSEQAQYRIDMPTRVLFLCTHNSARSQMAEGILRNFSGSTVDVVSAGSNPTGVHSYAVSALAKLSIDIHQQQSKHIDQYHGQSFDYIITVCDRVREACPIFPDDPERIHWSFPDPAAIDEPARYAAFEQTAQELVTRIRFLLTMIEHKKGKAR